MDAPRRCRSYDSYHGLEVACNIFGDAKATELAAAAAWRANAKTHDVALHKNPGRSVMCNRTHR